MIMLNQGAGQIDTHSKLTCKSNSTIDVESRVEEPFNHWEPCWANLKLVSIKSFLSICPCSRPVLPQELHVVCESPYGRFYLAHLECIESFAQFTEYTRSALTIHCLGFKTDSPFKVGSNEFLVETSLQHPLSSHKFYSLTKKLLQHEKKLNFEVFENNGEFFEPNSVVLPLKEFKCNIKITPLFPSSDSYKLYFRVDLTNLSTGIHLVSHCENNVNFLAEFEIIEEASKKKEIIDGMNFKYKRDYVIEDFVKLNRFCIEFNSSQLIETSNRASRTESWNSESENVWDTAVKSSSPVFSQKEEAIEKSSNLTEFLSNIKTQNGSKEFQKKVKNMKHEEIESVIWQVLPHVEEIILNDYANYMFQSLLSSCTFEQRMRIIMKISDILTRLVCEQQGTFVFQQLISLLTSSEEFECICGPASKDFREISLNNYGNHFMRKLIQSMPSHMLSMFMPHVYINFTELSENKNGVCVMKCIMRALKGGENDSQDLAYYLRKYIDSLTINTKQLINNEFGNYLIQEAYDLMGGDRLQGVSDYIVKFFCVLSCQKFASNVTLNCINKYWSEEQNIFKVLKQSIEKKDIVQMYNSKEGNKVLLEIMELPFELGLKDKISSVLRNEQTSKFNNRRWVGVTGKCKTGAVGSNYNSFSEAHSFTKRKYYN